MDTQEHNMIPSVDLPKPPAELPRSYEQSPNEVVNAIAVEHGQATAPPPVQSPLQPQVLAPPLQAPIANPQAVPMPVSSYTPTPHIAEDSDLIEKEWVERAKSIVEQTKTDPYLQNKELSRFRAEYIKKRYDKDIKINQE